MTSSFVWRNRTPRWGYRHVRGELIKLGVRLAASTIAQLMKDHHLGPAPRRSGPTWRQVLRTQACHVVATDFFPVDTILFTRRYVLLFIDLGRRRVWITAVTEHPKGAWVTQQARTVTSDLQDDAVLVTFLVRECDTTYTAASTKSSAPQGAQTLTIPFRTPNANAYAQRCVRTIRSQCLDGQ